MELPCWCIKAAKACQTRSSVISVASSSDWPSCEHFTYFQWSTNSKRLERGELSYEAEEIEGANALA